MDEFCHRVASQFGAHARALRPVLDALQDAGLDAPASVVDRVIRECLAAALATYEDTNPRIAKS